LTAATVTRHDASQLDASPDEGATMRFPTALTCCATLAAALLVAGCQGQTEGGDEPIGQVHGSIRMTGGPRGASPQDVAGTVQVTQDGRKVQSKKLAAGENFLFNLPVGTYHFTVEGPDGACVPADVTVTASADLTLALECSRK
jgi:hypothetical protein